MKLTARAGKQARYLTYWANGILLASLFLPVCVETNRSSEVYYGHEILLIGLLGPLILQFGWIGNIALPVAALSRAKWPRYFCAAAFMNSILWRSIADDNGLIPITHEVGYFLWMISMLLGTASLAWFEKEKADQTDNLEGTS